MVDFQDGTASADFTPTKQFQGWPRLVHGSIIEALLDEVMAYVTYMQGLRTTTAQMAVRFHHPAFLEQPLNIKAWETSKARRLVKVEGAVTSQEGQLVAKGKATLFVLNAKQKQEFGLA